MKPEELEKILTELDAKGASREEIETVYNAYKSQGVSPGNEEPGFLQGLAQSVAKPFLSVPATAIGAAKAAGTRLGGGSREDAAKALTEGTNFGYLGNVKPLNASMGESVLEGQAPHSGEALKRTALTTAGTGAEIASYFMAPLKIGGGFWKTIKEVTPLAATFGTGKALQAGGEGKGLGESALEGGMNAVGAAAGYGLFKGGANLFANWGARALQSDAVQAAGSMMKDLAEKTWNALPEAFKNAPGTVMDMANATTRRTVAALRSEFDENYNVAKDAVIDSLMPEVNTPDLTFGKFQRSLSETMGNKFREKNTLYDNVKADTTAVDRFTVANSALEKAPKIPKAPSAAASAAERQAYMRAVSSGSESFQDFMGTMGAATKQPLTLKQIMGLWQDSMNYVPGATNEEKVVIRDFASGLYADARSVLEKKNPELLDQWDIAYQAHKKAVDLYESSVLNNLKSVGDVDTFVDKMLSKEMTRSEQDAFSRSLEALGESKPAIQDMFINSVLARAKSLKPNDSAKLIRDFLDNWGDSFLDPKQAKMLDDVASFMSGNFDEFVLGMRQAQGLTDEAAGELLQGQTQLDLLKTINDGRLDEIATRFTKMVDSPELEKTLAAFDPDEKNIIGLSITKNLFDEKLPVAALNANGTYKISPEFAKTLQDIAMKVDENKALQKIMTPEQLKALNDAADFAAQTEDLSEVPKAGYHRIMNGVIAAFYFARGWMPGGIRNAIEAASGSGEKTLLYYDAVSDLIEKGIVKPNVQYRIGDIMKTVLPGVGQVGTEAIKNI